MSRRPGLVVLATCVLSILAIGCGDSAPRAERESSGSVSSTNLTEAGVPDALNFHAPLVGGGEFAGAEYAGRPVVFWFWAPT